MTICKLSDCKDGVRKNNTEERHKFTDFFNKKIVVLHALHALHALHVHFSFLDISQTFSFFPRREMTCFAVVSTT